MGPEGHHCDGDDPRAADGGPLYRKQDTGSSETPWERKKPLCAKDAAGLKKCFRRTRFMH